MKKPVRLNVDLETEIHQSLVNKILNSVPYPFLIFEKHNPYPGKNATPPLPHSHSQKYFNDAVASQGDGSQFSELNSAMLSFLKQGIARAQALLDKSTKDPGNYHGPAPEKLKELVDGGVERLATHAKSSVTPWCSYLRVRQMDEPSIELSSPRINLDGIEIEVLATGQLWGELDWPWGGVITSGLIWEGTVSLLLAAEAHVDLAVSGVTVVANLVFDKLRLNYVVLQDIPLEGLANDALGNKPIYVYDASKIITSVPLLGSKFIIAPPIVLPPTPDGIVVGITLEQTP